MRNLLMLVHSRSELGSTQSTNGGAGFARRRLSMFSHLVAMLDECFAVPLKLARRCLVGADQCRDDLNQLALDRGQSLVELPYRGFAQCRPCHLGSRLVAILTANRRRLQPFSVNLPEYYSRSDQRWVRRILVETRDHLGDLACGPETANNIIHSQL